MKTLTEFNGFQIKQALEKKAALAAEGKSPEEMQAGLGEAFKMEGDKLKYFIAAIEHAEKGSKSLKRVVVLQLSEGEKAPSGAFAGEGFALVAESYPQAQSQKPKRDDDRGPRGRDGKKGRGGKGGRGGRDGRRGPPRDGAQAGAGSGSGERPDGGGGRGRPPRRDAQPQKPLRLPRPNSETQGAVKAAESVAKTESDASSAPST